MLIGRDTEMERFDSMLGELPVAGGALILRGEAGVGKSALLAEVARRAADLGYRVLRTVGLELEADLPFAGLHQLLHPLRQHFNTLPPKQRDSLKAALGINDAEVSDGYIVALAALNLLTEIAQAGPVVLIVDDAQWLDAATSSVLGFLGHRLASEPILLLAAQRIGPAARIDEAQLPDLDIGPLPPAASGELLDRNAHGLSDALRERVLLEAAGNPLALIELPAAADGAEPDEMLTAPWLPMTARLERSYGERIQGLPPRARAALEAAAVYDRSDAAEILAAARALVGSPVGLGDLLPAVEARLIDAPGREIAFHHPLVRSAVRQVAGPARIREVHGIFAELVTSEIDRWAWHASLASDQPDEAIAAALEDAAVRAQRRGSNTGAVFAFERASQLSPDAERRADRLLKAAECAVTTGRPDVVTRLADRAAQLHLTPQQAARITLVKASYNEGVGVKASDSVVVAELAESVAAGGDHELAMKMIWHISLRSYWNEPGEAVRMRVLRAVEVLSTDPLEARSICATAYSAPIARGRVVRDRCETALQRPDLGAFEMATLGAAAVQAGALDVAVTVEEAAFARLREEGRLHTLAKALGAHAYSSAQLGNVNAAIPTAEESVRLSVETGQPYMHAFALACQARVAALRGRVEECDELARRAEQIAAPVRCSNVLSIAQHARVQAALSRGEFDEALDRALRMHDPTDATYQLALKNYNVVDLSVAAMRSGRIGEVATVMAGIEEDARVSGSPELLAGLAVSRLLVAADEHVEDLYQAAVDADLSSRPFLRARSELAIGLWLRRQRRALEARRYLRMARDTFDILGLHTWSNHSRIELRAAGERTTEPQSSPADVLTPQEFQIARMAGTGLTNREIGKQLYISHRTVGAHLASVYAKLGIGSRVQLSDALARK
ncbi:LuxR family transcriptional regulator [Nocardioides sp. CER19]|uniref:helix-turn-helix transcriptional regulator n=1 Tax=Nocardioides sp. CER19 TaxID=3038538 RepID=UPI00244BFE3B|nr:LuxR family transcriptional regulator [Nocardioides sp. CER19]MDH2415260.1 AAA family ATPase [Nocardioides sp. CER19]